MIKPARSAAELRQLYQETGTSNGVGGKFKLRRKSFHFVTDRLERHPSVNEAFKRLARCAYGKGWTSWAPKMLGCGDGSLWGWTSGAYGIPREVANLVIARARKRLAELPEKHRLALEAEEAALRAALEDFLRVTRIQR